MRQLLVGLGVLKLQLYKLQYQVWIQDLFLKGEGGCNLVLISQLKTHHHPTPEKKIIFFWPLYIVYLCCSFLSGKRKQNRDVAAEKKIGRGRGRMKGRIHLYGTVSKYNIYKGRSLPFVIHEVFMSTGSKIDCYWLVFHLSITIVQVQ